MVSRNYSCILQLMKMMKSHEPSNVPLASLDPCQQESSITLSKQEGRNVLVYRNAIMSIEKPTI